MYDKRSNKNHEEISNRSYWYGYIHNIKLTYCISDSYLQFYLCTSIKNIRELFFLLDYEMQFNAI